MNRNRDFLAGLVATAFFALVLFVVIPAYVKGPSFIPGFVPPPDMWPRAVAGLGLVMGLLAIVFAALKMRKPGGDRIAGLGDRISRNKKSIGRFAGLLLVFAAFGHGLPVIGFVPATLLLLGLLFVMTGRFERKFWMLGLTIVFPIVLYLLFAELVHTPFPEGMLFSHDFPTL
ncbi:MAG: tripartite tricarboxylate transporter TctB family protein [Hyphomicrobiales bacterium]